MSTQPTTILIRALSKRLTALFSRLPEKDLRSFIGSIINKKSSSLSPDKSLKFILRLDNDLYQLESQAAIQYEAGVHPKHRLTQYHDFFVQHIGKGERVLDVGCRTGEVAFDIAQKTGAKVLGIDIDRESLEIGREKHRLPNLETIEADVYSWKPDRTFDVIVLSNVLEHLEDRSNLLRKLAQSTKAKRFLIRVPMFRRDWRVALKKEIGVDWRLDETHFTEFTPETFTEEIKAAGLSIVSMEIRWGEIWSELKV